FLLAYVIARRGRYNLEFNPHGLGLGEALIGDYLTIGFTRQQYRTAVQQLRKWNFATFKTTNKGTIAKLTDTRLFSIFRLQTNQQNNQQPTSSQPTEQPSNNQPANHYQEQKNSKNQRSVKNGRVKPAANAAF